MTPQEFNQMVSSMLCLYSEFLQVPKEEILEKITTFNQQLENQIKEKNEKLIQLGQDDQTTN
jgi:hypothetical protein